MAREDSRAQALRGSFSRKLGIITLTKQRQQIDKPDRQAGPLDKETEAAVIAAVSGAVFDWFGEAGDYAVPCDDLTAAAVARDALARLKEKMPSLFEKT